MISNTAAPLPYRQYLPHSIADRAYWKQARSHPKLLGVVEKLADRVAEIPALPTYPAASQYLAARRSNNRSGVDIYWHRVLSHLSDLVLNRCFDGDAGAGVDDKLLDWLFAIATQPSWVLSAHLPDFDLPLTTAPQLDLIACETAACLAETVQMIRPWINNQSQTLEASIVHEIDRRVLQPFVTMENHWWYDTDPKRAWNNWAGVCAGAILAACESLATIGQPRPAARAKAIEVLNTFLERAFTPAGECDEGIGYWSYGISMACLGWSRLSESEFRKCVNHARLKAVADYPQQVHLRERFFFSGNDAPLIATLPPVTAAYLAGAVQSPWLLQWAPSSVEQWESRDLALGARLIDAILESAGQGHPAALPAASRYIHDQQVGIFQNDLLVVCFSGGTNAEAHNHNDLGHFIVLAGDKLIIPDLGAPSYTADFFGPNRYTYLSTSSRGHCCPIINQQEQLAGGQAAGQVLELDLDKQILHIDMTSAYPPEARLARWTRAMRRSGRDYVLTDVFQTTARVPIENVMWSTVEPEIDGALLKLGPVTLTPDRQADISIEAIDPKAHRLRNFGERVYRIGMKYIADPAEALQVSWTISMK